MAFWSSYFHRSDADDSLARTLRGIRENVVAMQVVFFFFKYIYKGFPNRAEAL